MSDVLSILRAPELVESGVAALLRYAPGEAIIVAGSEDRGVFLIEQGSVRVSGRVEIEDSRYIQPGLCDLGPGDVFGELSLFEAAPRSASVIAVDAVELRVFDGAALADYFDRHPDHGYQVLKWLFGVLNGRLRQADRRLESLFAWGLRAHGIDRHL